MSAVTTMILVLTLGAPAAPAEPAPSAARESIRQAIVAVDARLAMLKALRERSAAGDRISIDAVRSALGVPSDGVETRDNLRRINEDLRDTIRIAEAERRRAAAEAKARAEARLGARTPVRPAPEVEKPGKEPVEPAPEAIPADPALRQRLAMVRYRDGDYARALRLYETLATTDEDTWLRLRIARCLDRLGHTDEARKAYEALVREHPEDTWAKAARWSLSILELSPDTVTDTGTEDGGDR
jgi:tetratricopeptide (TPR) repeat protein